MSVKIRLHRAGTRNRPFYRIVVADGRSPRDGRFIAMLGYYDPVPKTPVLRLDTEEIQGWIDRGAVPSDTVRSLIKKAAIWPTAQSVAEQARERYRGAVEDAQRVAEQSPAAQKRARAERAAEPEAKPAGKAEPADERRTEREAKPEAASRAGAESGDEAAKGSQAEKGDA